MISRTCNTRRVNRHVLRYRASEVMEAYTRARVNGHYRARAHWTHVDYVPEVDRYIVTILAAASRPRPAADAILLRAR